jgi:hypothetical protein
MSINKKGNLKYKKHQNQYGVLFAETNNAFSTKQIKWAKNKV